MDKFYIITNSDKDKNLEITKKIENYLKEKEWVQKKNLELYHIVSDIMNCDEVKLDDYFKTVLERKRRRPIL